MQALTTDSWESSTDGGLPQASEAFHTSIDDPSAQSADGLALDSDASRSWTTTRSS